MGKWKIRANGADDEWEEHASMKCVVYQLSALLCDQTEEGQKTSGASDWLCSAPQSNANSSRISDDKDLITLRRVLVALEKEMEVTVSQREMLYEMRKKSEAIIVERETLVQKNEALRGELDSVLGQLEKKADIIADLNLKNTDLRNVGVALKSKVEGLESDLEILQARAARLRDEVQFSKKVSHSLALALSLTHTHSLSLTHTHTPCNVK